MKVIELSRGASAAFAGMVLGELGAEVIRVDVPARDLDEPTIRFTDPRKITAGRPFAPPTPFREAAEEPLRVATARTARPVENTTCVGEPRGRFTALQQTALLDLVRDADALVEDLGPGGLDELGTPLQRLRRRRRGLVVVSISPFGQTGPHADWLSSELVLQAMGGIVHATGWDGEPPFKLAGSVAAFIAGLHAAIATFSAVFGVQNGKERGVRIDISAQEAFLQHLSRHIGQWAYSGTGQRRDRRSLDGQGVPSMARAADGWLCLAVRNARWDTVADLFGLGQFTGEGWHSARQRVERWPEIAPTFERSLSSRTREEWFAAASERGLIVGPVHDMHEVLANEQYGERRFFETDFAPGLPFTWEASQ